MWLCVSTGKRNYDRTNFAIKTHDSNFGDELNFLIFPRLLGSRLQGWVLKQDHEFLNSASPSEELLFGIGSLLQDLMPSQSKKLIFGAGYGWGLAPDISQKWKVLFPRGPLTSYALGHTINAEHSCDGAYLLRLLPEWNTLPVNKNKKRKIVIPHHGNKIFKKYFFSKKCNHIDLDEFRFISPTANVEWILEQILESDLVYAEAMHAAIAADILRRPWQPVKIGEPVCEFKWHDWAASMEMTYRPLVVVRSWRKVPVFAKFELICRSHVWVEKIAAELRKTPIPGFLSDDNVFERRLDFLAGQVNAINNNGKY